MPNTSEFKLSIDDKVRTVNLDKFKSAFQKYQQEIQKVAELQKEKELQRMRLKKK